MTLFIEKFLNRDVCKRLLLALLAVITVLPPLASSQSDNNPSYADEGCLLYRSPVSGKYDRVPLLHTDIVLGNI